MPSVSDRPGIPETTPVNTRQRQAIDIGYGVFTTDTKSHPKGTMGQTKFQTLIDDYLGDMRQRGCTADSILTNRCALGRFSRFVSTDGNDKDARPLLDHVNKSIVEGYINQLHSRKVRWRTHPNRDPKPGKLSPFTVRKEIRILISRGSHAHDVHPGSRPRCGPAEPIYLTGTFLIPAYFASSTMNACVD